MSIASDPMTADAASDALQERFESVFGPADHAAGHAGGRLRAVRAPGRVNLIGEHTDYNDGFVLPMAIEPHVLVTCRARHDGLVRVASTLYPGRVVEFSVRAPIGRGEPAWANYVRGVAAGLAAAGVPLVGMDALIDNTLPPGGGLSSSAAVEVGTARALLAVAGATMNDVDLVKLCQRAEHAFAGVPCGIMDQTIVTRGRAGHAMLLDCRSLAATHVAIDPGRLAVVVINSTVKHDLASGAYAERRAQCEAGAAYFRQGRPGVTKLRDVTPTEVDTAAGRIDDVTFRRCRHVVSENARTTEFAAHLGAGRYAEAGALMGQSHASLREDFEVSCPEVDFLVEHAARVDGVYGARMTGGGFGGCVVALARPDTLDPLRRDITRAYRAKFNLTPSVFFTGAAAGASLVE